MKYNSPYSTAAFGSQAKDWEQGIDYHRLSKDRLKRVCRCASFSREIWIKADDESADARIE